MTDAQTGDKKPSKILRAANAVFVYLGKKDERSNLLFVSVAVGGFLMSSLGSYGFSYLWDKYGPQDSTGAKLDEISQDANDIKSGVQELRAQMTNLSAEIPAEQINEILAQISAIEQRANNIVPTAAQVAASERGYINGARVSDGPHMGTGTFYLTVSGSEPSSAEVCGGYHVSQRPYNRTTSLSHAGQSNVGYFGDTVYLEPVQVTVSGQVDPVLGRQVVYNCNAKSQ